jgi:hypothetical protein
MAVLLALVLLAAATRLLPHPPNFTAVGAVALFGGAYFARRWLALVVPLAAMAASDLVLTSPEPTSYLCFAMTVLLGLLLKERVTVGRTTAAAIAASVLFFAVSNFSVWWGSKSYPQNAAGLLECYAAAMPFAVNMLVGNLFYCGVLFGTMEVVQRRWPSLAAEPLAVPVAAPVTAR